MRCTRRRQPRLPVRLWYAVQWLPARVSYAVRLLLLGLALSFWSLLVGF